MRMRKHFRECFDKVDLKQVIAGAVAGAMLMGGGLCFAASTQDNQNDQLGFGFCRGQDFAAEIQNQAAEKNITLIDEAKVKNITSKAIGVKEKDLNLRCRLMNFKGEDGTEFKPFYSVHCFNEGIMYSLNIDAVSGEVIKDYSKFHFGPGGFGHRGFGHRGPRDGNMQSEQQ